MTDLQPNNVNEWNFNPSAKAEQEYRDTNMSKSQYLVLKSRWLKNQAAQEGKEYKPGYVPKGYTPIFTQQSAQKPNSIYWKPDNYARYRPDLPGALWDMDKDVQNYWHNPTNVVSWMNRFSVQDKDYEPPEGIDKKFIEDQYDALKDFNDDEDDPLYWKPLPIGHEAAYLTNFNVDPDNGDVPIYRSVIDQLNSPEMLAKRYREYEATAMKNQEAAQAAEQQRIQAIITEANTAKSAQEVLNVLDGKVNPAYYNELKTYYQDEGQIPLDDGTFKTMKTPEGGSYTDLYPWQRGVQTIGSSAEMTNRPESSTFVANLVGSLLPAVGAYGMASQVGMIAAGTAATGVFSTGATAAAAAAAVPVAGIPLSLIVLAGSTLLAGATFAYMWAHKDDQQVNSPVQKIFQMTNAGAEAAERGMGALQIAAELQSQGKPVDWRAAYDAGYIAYETQPMAGNFLLNLASWASEGVDRLAGAVGIESNLSSGESAGKDEVWLLDQGYKEPQKVEGGLGVPMMLSAYDALKALGDERTRDDMQGIWGYYTSLTGSGGTFNDFVTQSLVDPMNYAQALGNKGVELAATKGSKYFAAKGDVFRANSLESLAQASRWAQGNLLIDALPFGVQQLAEKMVQGFETKAQWKKMTALGDTRSLAEFKVKYNPKTHGTWGVGDTLFNYQAMMGTGYTLPGTSEYIIHPGGKAYDAVRIQPYSDGSLKILNVDGSKVWEYNKSMLDKLGVTFNKNAAGDLSIEGVQALFKDVGLDTTAVRDLITTSIKWKELDVVKPDIISAEGSDYIDATNPDTYTVKKDNKTYTVKRVTNMVEKVVDADGNEVKLDKPTVWGARPMIIGKDIMSAGEADLWHDIITITESKRAIALDPTMKSAVDLKMDGLRGKLNAMGLKNVDAAIEMMQKFIELNPGTKAMIESENLKESILFTHMLSGNNFELTMRAIKKFVTGADVGELSRAVETFYGQATTVANVGEAMKTAFGDGSYIDVTMQLYKDTAVKRAFIDKVSKALDVTPHKLVDMSPNEIIKKLTNRLAAKNDETSRLLMEQIADKTISAESLAAQMKAFQGKDALPLTNQDFLAMTTMYAEKAVQDYLISKYGIKKLPTLVRLSGMKKALISPFLIAFPYTTWMNNLWSNIGVQVALGGVLPLHGKTAKEQMIARLGLDALPWAPSDRMGLASDLIASTSKIQLLLNPNDSINKVTRTLSDFGGMVKAYSKIEEYNTSSLFIAEVMNMHRRIRLPDMPENIKQAFLAEGLSSENMKLIQDLFDGTMSPDELANLLRSGIEYNAIEAGAIEEAAGVLGKNDPARVAKYIELAKKLGADEEFMKVARQIKKPEDMYLIRDAFEEAAHRQLAIMMDESVRSFKFEVQNIITKEGMAGGIKLMNDAIYGELDTRYKNSVAWGEAKAAADAAKKVADYAASNRIIRHQREMSNRRYAYFYALQDTQFKAMVDILKVGDANAKAFADLIVKRRDLARRTMAQIDKNYNAYFDADANGTSAKWDDTVSKNESLMERLDKSEMKSMNEIAKLWTTILGSNVAEGVAASGISAADLKTGGKAMMKRMVDGYEELNKLRSQHYKDIQKLSGNDRRAAQATFWNEVWQPKVGELMAYFTDENWNKFYKVRTDLEKTLFPNAGQPETPDAPVKPMTPEEQAVAHVESVLAQRELDETTKRANDNLHTDAAAEHTRQIWYAHLADLTGMTPAQKAWAMTLMDTYDAVWSKRTGKPAGSWWAEQGTVAARMSTSDNDMKQIVGNRVIKAAGITRWDEVEKQFDILINSKNHNASTWLREVDRVIFQTKLIDDADKAIIVRTYGGLELDAWNELETKVHTNRATPAEVDLWRKVSDDFTNAHRKWLVEDAFDAAPGELKGVFGRINYAIRTLVNNIKTKLINFGAIPEEVKSVFDRLHFLDDVEEFKDRNAVRVAGAPTGRSTHILGTIDAKKQYPVTAKLVDLDHVIGSHKLNTLSERFEWNEGYDRTLQQRIREAFVNEKQIKDWANPSEFNPLKLIWDFHNLSDGAPIVNDDMQVLSGNGRTLMLEYIKFKFPASWDAYQQTLRAEAKNWGFTDADFEGIDNPVLVLHMTGEYDANDFIVDANKPTQAMMSQYETALTHVRYLPGELIGKLEFSSQNNIGDSLLLAKNQKTISAIMSKLPDSKPYIDMNTGALTPAGIDMLSYAMFAKVFNSDSGNKLLLSLINNPDSNIKNLQNGLMNALPQLAKLSALIESGEIPADLLPTDLIAHVVRRVSDLKASKTKLAEYLGKTDALFGEAQDTPVQMKFVTYIMEHARSSKAITDLLVEYANQALNESTQAKIVDTAAMLSAEESFGKALDIANKQAVADDLEVNTLGNFAKRAAESPLVLLGEQAYTPLKAKLAEMLAVAKKKPKLPPEWYNTFTINDAGYPEVIKMLTSMIGDDTVINPLRTQLLARAWDALMKTDDGFRSAVNANNTPEGFDARARGLSDQVDDAQAALLQPVEEITGEEPKQYDIYGKLVTPEQRMQELSDWDKKLQAIAKEALEIKNKAPKPVHGKKMVIDGVLQRIDQLFIPLDEEMTRLNNQIEGANQPGLFQKTEEIPPTMPITEYPVGSQPVHQNIGAGLDELYQFDVPTMLDTMVDVLTKRMKASERPKYTINLTEGQQKVLSDYIPIAAENQRLRMATVLDGAKRITKDLMIDYSRKRGFDTMLEMVLPYQFWYTRSTLMWLKRMMAKPNVMAMAYRYRELQRRNEMTGFPSRMGGKTPIYAPWLPEEMGDYMFVNPGNKFFTPEQLFQPFNSFASLDAETTKETQQYILDLIRQKTISPEDGERAILDKTGTIWEDALQYVKLNTMSDKTDAFTMASMVMNPDPIMNAMYQFGRGTPEKISPLPLTRLGNAFEAVGGDNILGIIGAVLSYPEDTIRDKAGIPQAGEWGDYYVDFFLSNLSVTGNYSVDEIKEAMISRQGAAFEEATLQAQQYIALRTPGTAFFKTIQDGHREPNVLASAFLMSFLPSGLYPKGEMELRGLKDEYSQAWNDYERGDTEALERFNTKYPEYETRMMMFRDPEQRLRGHLINAIWDAYTKLPTANQQIAADSLGSSFKAYFLDTKTRDYDRVDENTLTNWARRLGYKAPATPATQQAATETIEPMQAYPEDTAATIQSFIDERNTMFPDYWLYQGVYYDLPKSERAGFLKTVPMLKDYWDWKKEVTEGNPTIQSYLDDRAAAAGSYDTEYEVEAAQDKIKQFDSSLLGEVLYYQYTGEPLSAGAKAELNTMFQLAGKPGGDFQRWLRVLLGE